MKSFFMTVLLLTFTSAIVILPMSIHAANASFVKAVTATSVSSVSTENGRFPKTEAGGFENLGGNLPNVITAHAKPYLVVADIYVPSGKTVTIEPGVILLFKNFTGLHVEGRLVAEGSEEKPIIFSSEFDKKYVSGASLQANPYDWNGINMHESALGSSFAHCTIAYSVYGINCLTKYIKLDKIVFVNNGRADLTITAKKQIVSSKPFSYALTIADARKDGVPVKILMDPNFAKRSVCKYGGLSLLVGGITTGIWSCVQLNQDRHRLSELQNTLVIDEKSNLVANQLSDWEKAESNKNRDTGFAAAGFILAFTGCVGISFSFTF